MSYFKKGFSAAIGACVGVVLFLTSVKLSDEYLTEHSEIWKKAKEERKEKDSKGTE